MCVVGPRLLFLLFLGDGISTTLNISGSQDCALDCPTTDEGCIKSTCCQNNNKVSQLLNLTSHYIVTLFDNNPENPSKGLQAL